MKTHHTRLLTTLAGFLLLLCGMLRAQTGVIYIGPTAGDNSWTLGSNWSGGVAPTTTAFNATINNGGTVNMPFVNITINDFNLISGALTGSALTAAGLSTIGDGATVGNSQLRAYGGLTFQGSANLSNNGIVNGDGTAAATATWGSGTLSFVGSSVDNRANATWNASSGLYDSVSGSNSFSNNGTFNKLSAATLTIEPVFNQSSTGTLNVNAGELQLLGGGSHQGFTSVINDSVLTLAGTHGFSQAASVGSVSVASTATLHIASGTTTLDLPHDHSATAIVDAGATLVLRGNGTHTGNFAPAAGGAVNFDAGTQTIATTATHTGAGSLNVNGATVQLATGVALSGSGAINISAGTLSSAGTAEISHPVNFTAGAISGGGTLTLQGTTTFSGSGSKQTTGNVTVNLGDGIGAPGSVAANWTGGTLDIRSSTVNIKADAAFTTNFDGTINNGGGTLGTINVEAGGTFTKSGGSGLTSIAANGNFFAFNNNGSVNVQSGTLQIGVGSPGTTGTGGTHTGLFDVGSGTTLNFAGVHTFNAGTTFTGAGGVILTGTTTDNAGVNFTNPTTLNGNLTGPGNSSFTGMFTWTLNGVSPTIMNGAGTTNVLGSTATFGGTAQKQLSGGARQLVLGNGNSLDGTVSAEWSGGSFRVDVGSALIIRSDATLANTHDGSFTSSGTFTNQGTFTKSIGTGTTTFSVASFSNTGTVNASSGTLALNSTTLTQHSGTTLTGGTWNVTNGAAITRTAGSNITTIGSAATVLLDGAGSSFAKVTTALNNNQGSFTIKNDRDLTTAGAYTNSGTTRVESSTIIDQTVMTIGAGGSAAYTQTGGETVLVGGALIDASVFNLNGGVLKGTGTVASSVITSGTQTIAPGLSPGTLTIEGNLTLSAGSTLAMEIGGLGQGTDYDFLDVNGTLTLAGLLDLDMLNSFENLVQSSDVFTLATANSPILGAFGNVASGSRIWTNTHISFDVWYGAGSIFDPNSLVITGAPEPSRALLLMAGMAGLLMRRRRTVTKASSFSASLPLREPEEQECHENRNATTYASILFSSRITRNLRVPMAALVCLFLTGVSHATSTLFSTLGQAPTGYVIVTNDDSEEHYNQSMATDFRTGAGASTITGAWFGLINESPTNSKTFLASIYSDNGGTVGTLVGDFDPFSVPSNSHVPGSAFHATTSGINLAANTNYWVYLHTNDGNVSVEQLAWAVAEPGNLLDAGSVFSQVSATEVKVSQDFGVTFTDGGNSYTPVFSLEGTQAVPEPSRAVLLMLGLMGLTQRRKRHACAVDLASV